MKVFCSGRRAIYALALLTMAVIGSGCAGSVVENLQEQHDREVQQYRGQISSCFKELGTATMALENAKATHPEAFGVTPPTPTPPPPPRMPEWQVVRYASNGSVAKTIPVFWFQVQGNCLWFTQSEQQSVYSQMCGGQFDIVKYEPK